MKWTYTQSLLCPYFTRVIEKLCMHSICSKNIATDELETTITTANIQICTIPFDCPGKNILRYTGICYSHILGARQLPQTLSCFLPQCCAAEEEPVVGFTTHCMTAVSRPPVEMRRESSWRKPTAVTWLLWPLYSKDRACEKGEEH